MSCFPLMFFSCSRILSRSHITVSHYFLAPKDCNSSSVFVFHNSDTFEEYQLVILWKVPQFVFVQCFHMTGLRVIHLGHECHQNDAISSLVHLIVGFLLSVCLTAGDVMLPLITWRRWFPLGCSTIKLLSPLPLHLASILGTISLRLYLSCFSPIFHGLILAFIQ